MGVINEGFNETICIGGHTYQVLGNSAKGSLDKINQDSFGLFYDSEYMIAVVADGLGSASLSHIGSHNVVKSVFKVLLDNPCSEKIWNHIYEDWKSYVGKDAEQCDTTCKFVCITEETITIGSIGDGWIGILNTDSYHELENNNTFTNMTESMCSQNIAEKACILECDVQDVLAIGLSTDGFSEDFERQSRREFLTDCCISLKNNPDLIYDEISSVLNNWPVKSNKDDKTLILIKKVE